MGDAAPPGLTRSAGAGDEFVDPGDLEDAPDEWLAVDDGERDIAVAGLAVRADHRPDAAGMEELDLGEIDIHGVKFRLAVDRGGFPCRVPAARR